MAESVDALVSNTSGAIHPGSIPGLGTKLNYKTLVSQSLASVFCFLRCTKSVLILTASTITQVLAIAIVSTCVFKRTF